MQNVLKNSTTPGASRARAPQTNRSATAVEMQLSTRESALLLGALLTLATSMASLLTL
ncbi:MAG: hypothetical protein R3E86_22585 [Pseudomonadales bacterium]